ncbi:hypothetical protein [Curvibacter lanceolatus]|uniref:hypothetical protein n=1 Tax=Curvibacter lanceolatus TaxID=86182 RepID=UPI0012F96697|nr:hypothetical protein [Curvibacter lanceolatus]
MLTEEQIDAQTAQMFGQMPGALLAVHRNFARAIEQAVRKEMEGDTRDAARYRLMRRGQRWSIINGIGDVLRGEELDKAVDSPVDAGSKEMPADFDPAQPSITAHWPLEAPWTDFAGNPIHAGDTIRHPTDGSEGLVFVDHSMLDSAK